MRYVCNSLTWWPSEVLVAELKSEQSSHEMDVFSSPVIMDRRPHSLTVPIPMAVQTLTGEIPQVVFDLFMQRLTALLSPLDMGLVQMEQIYSALIRLAWAVQNSLSTQESRLYTTVLITEYEMGRDC